MKNFLKVFLATLLAFVVPIASAVSITTLSDTFTGTNGTALTAHTPDFGGSWINEFSPSATIQGNKLDGGTTFSMYEGGSVVMDTADYTVSADIIVNSTIATGSFHGGGITVRQGAGSGGVASNYTFGIFELGSGPVWGVFMNNGVGVNGSVGSQVPVTLVPGTTYNVQLICSGSTITGKVNGSTMVTGTDTTVTAAGKPGFYFFGGSELAFDNLAAVEVVSAFASGTASAGTIGATTATVTSTSPTGGRKSYTYQWYRSTTSGFTPGGGNIVSGATSLTLNDTGLTASTAYFYKLIATDAEQTPVAVTSNQVSVTTTPPTLISGSITVNSVGSTTASLTCTAASGGTPTYTYQWYRSTTSGFTPGGGNIVSGATSLTLNDTGLTAATTYYYKVRTTDSGGTPQVVDSSQAVASTTGGAVFILPNDASIRYSPYNWSTSSSHARTTAAGAYATFSFTSVGSGTAKLNVDTSGYLSSTMSLDYSVDGGSWQNTTLNSSTTQVTLASGLSAAAHTIKISLASWAGTNTDAWTAVPPTRLDFISLELLNGSTAGTIVAGRSRNMIVFGDSISAGLGVGNARYCYVRALAESLDAECGQVAYGAQGFTTTGSAGIPPLWTSGNAAQTAWNQHYSGVSRLSGGLLVPTPDYIVLVHGTNDGLSVVADSSVYPVVTGWISAVRAAAPSSWIFVCIPFGQFKAAAITTGFNNYQASTPDKKCVLINLGTQVSVYLGGPLGSANIDSIDQVHPTQDTHARLGAAVATQIKNTLRAPAGMMGM